MIAAAPVPLSRSRELLAPERARQHGQHVVAFHQRHRQRGRRGAHRGDAGDDLGAEPAADPLVHVHVAAVEQRVALGQQDHVATLRQVRHEPGRGLLVELLDRGLVTARVVGGLGRDRVHELFLDLVAAQVGRGDRARDRTPVAGRVVGDDVGGADEAGRLHGDQLGVAGAEPDAVQHPGCRVHSASLAIALTAAAVIALPPRRPCTTRYSRPGLRQRPLRFRGADEADRDADHRRRARTGPAGDLRPVISSRRNSAVGALPIATTAPSSRSPHRSTAAAERVVPSRAASAATAGSLQGADDLVAGGQPRPGDPGRDHLRVAQDGRAAPQRGPRVPRPGRRCRRRRGGDRSCRRSGSSGPRPAPGRPGNDPVPPRPGWWRRTGGRSPRRRGRSQTPATW